MVIVDESKISSIDVPGRKLKWLLSPETIDNENVSVCVINVPAGNEVRPAHSHPNGEEFIFIMEGEGHVMVDQEVEPVKPGVGVLFTKGSVHMLKNTGDTPMKVICFFTPATGLEDYRMFENVDFPEINL